VSVLIATLVCSQVVFPQQAPITFGNADLQHYLASEGAIAWTPDGGLAALWLDSRRSLGEAKPAEDSDLWGARLAVGRPSPIDETGLLLRSAPPQTKLFSPGMAFNRGFAALVWLEQHVGTGNTTVQLLLVEDTDTAVIGLPKPVTTSPGITGVTVSASGAGFIVAWSVGDKLIWNRIDTTGRVFLVPTAFQRGLGVRKPLVAGLVDGGAYFAHSNSSGTQAFLLDEGGIALASKAGELAGIGLVGAPKLYSRDLDGGFLIGSTYNYTQQTGSGFIVSGNETLTGLAFEDFLSDAQVGFIRPNGELDVIEASPGRPVSVAVNATHGAFLNHFGGLSVVTRKTTDSAVSPQVDLNLAQPTQRGPSVAWLPKAGGFVVVYEERESPESFDEQWTGRLSLVQLDGGTVGLGTTGPLDEVPVFPRVVEWDSETVGLEEFREGERTHRLYSQTNGFLSDSQPLTELDWRSSAGAPLLRWRQAGLLSTEIDLAVRRSLRITSPRCAISLNGKHILAGWSGNSLQVYEVSASVSGPISIATTSNPAGRICATRGRANTEALLTWVEGDSIRILPFGAPAPQMISISRTNGDWGFENPVATRLGSGILVVWETPPSYSTVGAAFVDDSDPMNPVPVDLRTGSDLVRQPTVTSAPGGPAIVAWQEFDRTRGVGATRVRSRLVFPSERFDTRADAGTVVFDAGVPDDFDAGPRPNPDAGGPAVLELVPTCGCTSASAHFSLAMLATLGMWRRSRSRKMPWSNRSE
jgi:hypothetical protein